MTKFQQLVYAVVKQIPEGKTMTYKEVAVMLGVPGAARAVGSALRKNFDLTVPCHRVIRSDGKMGGYNRGGITKKLKILIQEKAIIV